MLDNALSQKIIALVIDRIGRYEDGALRPEDDVADKVIQTALAKDAHLGRLAIGSARALRARPRSVQQSYMGAYWNRRMTITKHEVAINKARTAESTSSIPTRSVEVMRWPSRPFDSNPNITALLEYLKEKSAKADAQFYDEVALELDLIDVKTNGELGDAEVIVIGGASDGSLDRVKGLITHVRRPGDGDVRRFHGGDRIAVPWWPLTRDGRSSIVFYGEVRELDARDRNDYLLALDGAAGLAEAIISGLMAGGVVGGPVGAIAGAVVGAVVGLITIFVALNDDDDWGSHEIRLSGPFSRADSAAQTPLSRHRSGSGYDYTLKFMQLLREA